MKLLACLLLVCPCLLLAACASATANAPPITTAAATPILTTLSVVALPGMSASRAAHVAVLLPNGKVLLAGGFDASHRLASAELFDPTTRTFERTGAMSVARVSATATLLPNGKALIAGGLDGEALATAELYDPASGAFTPTGSLKVARHDQVAVLLANGKVLLTGGVGVGYTFLSSAELYDPASGTFSLTGSMAVPREGHTATLLPDGRVLVAGGHTGRHEGITIYSSAELYDPASGTFSPTGSMTVRRHKHDATLLPDDTVFVSGGADERDDQGLYSSTELYDPRMGTFRVGPAMHFARYKHQRTSLLLPSGKLLVSGGAPVAELFDPLSATFSVLPNSPGVTRLFATATLVRGGVLVAGGYGTNIAASAQAWLYNEQP